MKWVYTFDGLEYPNIEKQYKAGDEVLVYSKTFNNNGGKEVFCISKEYAKSGYPGNMNPEIKRFHGWRGETNDIAVNAYGVYRVKTVEVISKGYDDIVKITIDRKDIKKGEE